MEPIYRQELTVTSAAVDCFGRLKPSMLLHYAQEIAGAHSAMLSHSYDALMEKGLFWAIIRNHIQIDRLPMVGESITLETWPMPTTRSAYPRATVGYDKEGRRLFCMIGLWVLMDANTRAMVLPGKSGVIVEGILRGTELAVPKSLLPKPLGNTRSRQVCFTDLDRNGHMNNCRYLDWLDDLTSGEFHLTHTVKEMTLCYLNEAREGQTLDLSWEQGENGSVLVDIHRDTGKADGTFDRVFAAKMIWEPVVL